MESTWEDNIQCRIVILESKLMHLENLSFSPLVVDGENQIIKAFDNKLHLQTHGLAQKIKE